MKNKIINYIKSKKKEFKKLKKKLENKNITIQEQAESINFLIKEMNIYKEDCIKLQREVKELKKIIKESENK